MTRASATLSKSRSLLIEACTITHSSRVKPLRSSSMSDRCPSLRCVTDLNSNVVVARHTVSCSLRSVWTGVLQGDGTGGMILWIRVLSREKPFLAYDDSVCQYHMFFCQQLHTDYRSQLPVPRRMRHRAVRHRLLTSLQCIGHQFDQQCAVESGNPIHGNLLRLQSRIMRLNAFQHDFKAASRKYNTEENCRGCHGATMKLKRDGAHRSQVDPVHCLEQASVFC